MKKIEEVDENFIIKTGLSREDIKVYNVCEEPFRVFGVIPPSDNNDCFHRIPHEVAKEVSECVDFLNTNTAGGRVRFATDSEYIAIIAHIHNTSKSSKSSFTNNAGFDLYFEDGGVQKKIITFVPPYDDYEKYDGEINIKENKMREYTLYLPSYGGVKELYIALSDKATVKTCRDYIYKTPIMYYGSSITQGGCASRPGMIYQNIITRRLDSDYINLGFSGSALAEDAIANYIAKQKMSVFVYDYDYNAPDCEYLEKTHEKMYKIVREAQPDLPIICLSMPSGASYLGKKEADERKAIIKKTYDNAVASGDKNIYFIDGSDFAEELGAGDNMFIDFGHPNDLGFFSMANRIERELRKIIK